MVSSGNGYFRFAGASGIDNVQRNMEHFVPQFVFSINKAVLSDTGYPHDGRADNDTRDILYISDPAYPDCEPYSRVNPKFVWLSACTG